MNTTTKEPITLELLKQPRPEGRVLTLPETNFGIVEHINYYMDGADFLCTRDNEQNGTSNYWDCWLEGKRFILVNESFGNGEIVTYLFI